jgi:hypothetical protein
VNLGIVDCDRGTGDDNVRTRDVGGSVALENGRAQSGKPLGDR